MIKYFLFLLRKMGYDLVRYKPHILDTRKFFDQCDRQEYHPRLLLHTWRYGVKDIEARRKAHDFVKEFLASYKLPPVQSVGTIPRKIWVYWDQGWDSAPPMVRACRRKLEHMNPDFDLRFVDYTFITSNLSIPSEVRKTLESNKTKYANIVRCALLAEYGGIWLDATCYVTQPLERLLDKNQNRYFSYTRSDKLLSTWMMIAPGNHIIPTLMRDVQLAWWQKTSELPAYFWFHYLFEALCNQVPAFEEAWAERLYMSGQSNFLAAVMDMKYTEMVMRLIEVETYVQKLSFKASWAKNPTEGSFAWHIMHGT